MTSVSADTGLAAGTWSVDASHSEVGFTVRHLMSRVRGRFTDFAGEIVTTGNPLESTVSVNIKSPSISTNNEQRDRHLRSADFFDPEKGGELTFVSTRVTEGTDGYVITGDLSINGTTRSVDLTADFLGVDTDAYGLVRLGAEATTSIDRKDYGIEFNVPLDGGKLLIGDKVTITLIIEAVKA